MFCKGIDGILFRRGLNEGFVPKKKKCFIVCGRVKFFVQTKINAARGRLSTGKSGRPKVELSLLSSAKAQESIFSNLSLEALGAICCSSLYHS